jgi:hypothetical protein
MKSKRTNYAGVIALLMFGAVGVLAIGFYIKKTPEAQQVPPAIHRQANKPDNVQQPDKAKTSTAVVLNPHSKNGELTFDSAVEPVPEGKDPRVFAINRYLQNCHILPPEAKALSIDVKEDGTAYVSCTEAMDKTYGSSDEAALLQGFDKTLGQFPEIKKVIFEVSGKPIDSFGQVDISQGMDITGPGDAPSTQTGA